MKICVSWRHLPCATAMLCCTACGQPAASETEPPAADGGGGRSGTEANSPTSPAGSAALTAGRLAANGGAGRTLGAAGSGTSSPAVNGGAGRTAGAPGSGTSSPASGAGGTAGSRAGGSNGGGGGARAAAAGRAGNAGPASGGSAAPAAGSGSLGSDAQCALPTGMISYTLSKVAMPSADQSAAYAKITSAMDTAITYYNCYTDITKRDAVTFEPSVQTADGNVNGSIRFGSTDSMNYITAMHEISHTVGIGSSQFDAMVEDGIFTGSNATATLRAITGNDQDQVHGDTQHFWPYGLNYTSEVKSTDDLLNHCKMVVAIRKDLGL
jgi:hypothetical protein